MHTTTAAGNVLGGALLAVVACVLAACAGTTQTVPMAYACGTNETPPIALDRAACDAVPPTGRWYSGRADDLDEPDEGVVIGQPLDEDWWDPIAQADLDDTRVHSGTGHGKPRASTPPPTTKAAPTTTRRAPSTRSTR